MANAKNPSKGKKTTQNSNIKKVAPVTEPEIVDDADVVADVEAVEVPVEETPVEPTPEERHKTLNTVMTMTYVDTISGIIAENKENILRAFIQSVPEDKQEAYANNVLLNATVRVITYEAVENSLSEEYAVKLAASDAFAYATMSAIKESCKGFEDKEINTEIVPLLSYGGQIYIVFREATLMQIAASEKMLTAINENAVAAICLNSALFPTVIIDLLMAHIGAYLPAYLGEEAENVKTYRDAFLQANGSIVIDISLNALVMIYNQFTLDQQQMFASIVGRENVRNYTRSCVIDTTSEKAVSSLVFRHVAEKGSELFEAMKEK